MEGGGNLMMLVKRLILMAVIAPFILLWGEVFTAVLFPQNLDSEMNIFASDPVIGYSYQPHALTYQTGREYNALYEINSLGLRDREYGPKKSGKFRVLLLGDSFSVSHGLPIEESLSRQMERALQSLSEQEGTSLLVEVVNGAVGGYSPYNYWKAYRKWAPLLEPDAVVVGLSPDDYDSSNAGLNYIIEDGVRTGSFREGEEPRKRGGGLMRRLRKWLSWNSQFYILLRNYLYYNDFVGRVSLWILGKGEGPTNQLQQFMVPQPERMSRAWKESFAFLDKLHQEASRDNVSLIMVLIPLKLEIIYAEYQRVLSASGLKENEIEINQPSGQVSAFCEDRDIPCLDPRTVLKSRHAEVPCYFVYDGHWNAEGVRVAADYLALQWRNFGLCP
jgi:hypothetical protein